MQLSCVKLLFIPFLLQLTHSLRVHGDATIHALSTLGYVGKFCYKFEHTNNFSTMPAVGAVDLEIDAVSQLKNVSQYWFVMYDDANWKTVRQTSTLTCGQQLHMANMKVQLSAKTGSKGRHLLKEHIRPRWWYAFILNCDRKDAEFIVYRAHFYQLHESTWLQELGVNDRHMNTMYLVFALYYLLLGMVQFASYRKVKQDRDVVHQVIKLFTISLALQFVGTTIDAANWVLFSQSGEHNAVVVYLAYAVDALTLTAFMLLLLVLAQGWTVTRQTLRRPKLLLGYSCFIFVYQVSFCVWRSFFVPERESVKYFYDSPPMYFFGALMALSGIIFAVQCFFSFQEEEDGEKRPLYFMLAVFFTLWFFMPLAKIGLAEAIAEYYRDIFVESVGNALQAVAFFIFVVLFWPSNGVKYFKLDAVHTRHIISGQTYEIATGNTDAGDEDENF